MLTGCNFLNTLNIVSFEPSLYTFFVKERSPFLAHNFTKHSKMAIKHLLLTQNCCDMLTKILFG